MELRKIVDGKLEEENFFLETPIEDFLGDFTSKTTEGVFTLLDGYIERPLFRDEYVMVVKKNFAHLTNEYMRQSFYIRNDEKYFGVSEVWGGLEPKHHKGWKFVRRKEFVQAYGYNENNTWEKIGGMDRLGTDMYQGFRTEGIPLSITDYQLYSSPYITILEVPEGSSAKGFNLQGEQIVSERFERKRKIELFLDDMELGYIEIYDEEGNLLMQTDEMVLQYGDTYAYISHRLHLYYKEEKLEHEDTYLRRKRDRVALVNESPTEAYERVRVKVVNYGEDTIKIALNDGEELEYKDYIDFEVITPMEIYDIEILIETKEEVSENHKDRFALEISSY